MVDKENPKSFDSYVDRNRIVIVTKSYSEIHMEDVYCENYISVDRAQEIINGLQSAIDAVTA